MTIKDIREFTGLSQTKFAKAFNLNVNTLRTWEQGIRNPPEYYMDVLATTVSIQSGGLMELMMHDECPGVDEAWIVDNVEAVWPSWNKDKLHEMLCERFGADDVVRDYKSDEYPFPCFYIKSRNLRIEIFDHASHGGHWFNKSNPTDRAKLKCFNAAFKADGDDEYACNVASTWSDIDIAKRWYAAKNGLNYVVFWDLGMSDVALWFSMGCPDGCDWLSEYSWVEDDK